MTVLEEKLAKLENGSGDPQEMSRLVGSVDSGMG